MSSTNEKNQPAPGTEPAKEGDADHPSSPLVPLLWILIPFLLMLLYGVFSPA